MDAKIGSNASPYFVVDPDLSNYTVVTTAGLFEIENQPPVAACSSSITWALSWLTTFENGTTSTSYPAITTSAGSLNTEQWQVDFSDANFQYNGMMSTVMTLALSTNSKSQSFTFSTNRLSRCYSSYNQIEINISPQFTFKLFQGSESFLTWSALQTYYECPITFTVTVREKGTSTWISLDQSDVQNFTSYSGQHRPTALKFMDGAVTNLSVPLYKLIKDKDYEFRVQGDNNYSLRASQVFSTYRSVKILADPPCGYANISSLEEPIEIGHNLDRFYKEYVYNFRDIFSTNLDECEIVEYRILKGNTPRAEPLTEFELQVVHLTSTTLEIKPVTALEHTYWLLAFNSKG